MFQYMDNRLYQHQLFGQVIWSLRCILFCFFTTPKSCFLLIMMHYWQVSLTRATTQSSTSSYLGKNQTCKSETAGDAARMDVNQARQSKPYTTNKLPATTDCCGGYWQIYVVHQQLILGLHFLMLCLLVMFNYFHEEDRRPCGLTSW